MSSLYGELGGHFLSTPSDIRQRLLRIKAFVFDWDGVFNPGDKTSSWGSGFSEVDSMGVNLLRFSYFLRVGELPVTLVISGENNKTAFYYSERENFRYSFYKVAHKIHALEHLCNAESLDASEICYFFDDVLDVPIAEKCGLRMQVDQKCNPLFIDYCRRNNLADYQTSARGGDFALREACELLIGLGGNYDEVIAARVRNSPEYQAYISARRKVKTSFFTLQDSVIKNIDPER